MTDIVERLRICAKFDPDQAEAADEIERLRAEIGQLRKVQMSNKITITVAELDRLSKWVSNLPEQPLSIRLEQSGDNGIGKVIVAYIHYKEDSGEWKQITDYKEW